MKLTFRTFSIAVAYTLFFVIAAISHQFFQPAPKPIRFVPITQQQIDEDVKRERQEKEFKKAVAAVRMVYRRNHVSEAYVEITAKAAIKAGISPRLLAGVVTVESHGNTKAKDGCGSFGLMQVNSKIWGHRKELTDPEKNLQIGSRILANYVHRFGLIEGLHHYNGYSEIHGHVYVGKVLTAGGLKG